MKVQALDPETKHWLFASILDLGEEIKVTWSGYSRDYDCLLPRSYVRQPVKKRPLLTRNAISKKDFPSRGDPKYLERGDRVWDTSRKHKFIVEINDPFEAQVCF